MLLGIGFLTVITAAITSTFVSRPRKTPSDADTLTAEELRQIHERLERIEAASPAEARDQAPTPEHVARGDGCPD